MCEDNCKKSDKKIILNTRKYSVKMVQEEVAKKGGKCLSAGLEGTFRLHDDISLECFNLHMWNTTVAAIMRRGTWCPYCSRNSSEEVCRKFFEQLFDNKFPKAKPDFLKNIKTGKNFELDGFCPQLNLAFEHQGEQHYNKDYYLYKTGSKITFEEAMRRDIFKQEKCNENNINLIAIPELISRTPIEGLKEFIKQKCIEYNIIIPKNYNNIEIDLSSLYTNKKLEKYIAMAGLKGGKYISGVYFNRHTKIIYECKEGHIVKISSAKLAQGKWCRKCGIESAKLKQRNDVKFYIKFIEDLGGTNISCDYINSRSIMHWICKFGHSCKLSCQKIQQGQECKVCSLKKRGIESRNTIDKYLEIIKSSGGEYISGLYDGIESTVICKCKDGHICETQFNRILQGSWCKQCGIKNSSKNRIKGVGYYLQYAELIGIQYVSGDYTSCWDKLIWKDLAGNLIKKCCNDVKRDARKLKIKTSKQTQGIS